MTSRYPSDFLPLCSSAEFISRSIDGENREMIVQSFEGVEKAVPRYLGVGGDRENPLLLVLFI